MKKTILPPVQFSIRATCGAGTMYSWLNATSRDAAIAAFNKTHPDWDVSECDPVVHTDPFAGLAAFQDDAGRLKLC